jgi:uncharacterized protein YjbI with pentapeptide repeats
LRVDHRTLVDHVWDDKSIVALRSDEQDKRKAQAAIEGLVLRARSLRFATLDQSSLFAADLTGADLRKASLNAARMSGATASGVQLQGAKMLEVQLQGALLDSAQLQGAELFGAQLQGAHLNNTKLQGAHLINAKLQGAQLRAAQLQGAELNLAQLGSADLRSAQLQGADLREAQLQGADLREAQLQGANLREAQLQGASLLGAWLQVTVLTAAQLQGSDLNLAQLQGAHLNNAKLQGAGLNGARLQGAVLQDAQLQGADLSGARLWQANGTVDVGLADLQDADFTTPLTDEEKSELRAGLDAIPDAYAKAGAEARFRPLFEPGESSNQLYFRTSPDQPILGRNPRGPVVNWSIASPTPTYTSGFVALLADTLAPSDSAIANGIVRRAINVLSSYLGDGPSLYGVLAWQLLVNTRGGKIKIEKGVADDLFKALRDNSIACAALEPAAPR